MSARWIPQLAVTDLHRLPETGLAWRRRSVDATRRAAARSRGADLANCNTVASTTTGHIGERARVSIRVARDQAEPLRRALFTSLHGRIKQLIVLLDREPDPRAPMAELQFVLERGAVADALGVTMIQVPGAQPGEVILL